MFPSHLQAPRDSVDSTARLARNPTNLRVLTSFSLHKHVHISCEYRALRHLDQLQLLHLHHRLLRLQIPPYPFFSALLHPSTQHPYQDNTAQEVVRPCPSLRLAPPNLPLQRHILPCHTPLPQCCDPQTALCRTPARHNRLHGICRRWRTS